MSQRDRLAPVAVSEPAAPAVETLPRQRPAEPLPQNGRDWEELFANLLPTISREHSPSANGNASEGNRNVINLILNEAALQLAPAHSPPLTFVDTELAEPQ